MRKHGTTHSTGTLAIDVSGRGKVKKLLECEIGLAQSGRIRSIATPFKSVLKGMIKFLVWNWKPAIRIVVGCAFGASTIHSNTTWSDKVRDSTDSSYLGFWKRRAHEFWRVKVNEIRSWAVGMKRIVFVIILQSLDVGRLDDFGGRRRERSLMRVISKLFSGWELNRRKKQWDKSVGEASSHGYSWNISTVVGWLAYVKTKVTTYPGAEAYGISGITNTL